MTTVNDIINAAGRKIGVVDESAEFVSDSLSALNMMLMEWGAKPNSISAITRETFDLSASTASYSVGSGQTIDTTWPNIVDSAFIRNDDTDYPLYVFSAKDYAYIERKADADRPLCLYYERTYPYGTFFFWPTPNQTYTVHLYSKKPFTEYTSGETTLTLPPEYYPAMIYNLAVELAPEYEKEPSNTVLRRAASTLKTLKAMNSVPIPVARTSVFSSTSSSHLFNGYDIAHFGSVTFPFILR